MKSSQVAIAAGETKDVVATGAYKSVRVDEDASPQVATLQVQFRQPDGTFSDALMFPPGASIRHSRSDSILARPANYNASGVPAAGEAYMKIAVQGGAPCNLKLFEFEQFKDGAF